MAPGLGGDIPAQVPHVNWLYTLGSATLFVAVVQAVTGILLTLYYVPTPIMRTTAWSTLRRNSRRAGSFAVCITGAPAP